ncbi:MAG: hypothetical protein GTO61_13525 [Gemmatimonadales bacterium]|nr:hypothetical protein [Gemmatimonadales bacterium]
MLHTLMLALALGASPADSIRTGEDLIRAMHARYQGQWYENLVLIQAVTYFDLQSGALDSARLWYESIQLPGTVRSDIAPVEAGHYQLFRDGTWHIFEADTLARANPGPHPVLLLGFDVYMQPVEETLSKLALLQFDLVGLREDTWQGREVYVVGSATDDRANQFWVDKEDLLLRRLIIVSRTSGAAIEVQFNDYRPLGGGWIAAELVFLRDGHLWLHERYAYWDIDVEFEPSIFATTERTRPTWVGR